MKLDEKLKIYFSFTNAWKLNETDRLSFTCVFPSSSKRFPASGGINPSDEQVLGGDQYRLHALPHQPPGVHDDLPGVVCLGHRVAGAAVRLEGPGLPTTNRAAKVHGFTGHRIPGECGSDGW